MPVYTFRCEKCNFVAEVTRAMKDVPETLECPTEGCGENMCRDYQADNIHAQGDRQYRRPIISDSLAVNPCQVEEHRRRFPEIKMHDDGRPEFTDYKSHNAYLEKIGAQKHPQRQRRRGRKIA